MAFFGPKGRVVPFPSHRAGEEPGSRVRAREAECDSPRASRSAMLVRRPYVYGGHPESPEGASDPLRDQNKARCARVFPRQTCVTGEGQCYAVAPRTALRIPRDPDRGLRLDAPADADLACFLASGEVSRRQG